MSAVRTSTDSPRNDDEIDEVPPPYTPYPTDELTLEIGPSRPFQQHPPQQQPRPRPPQHQERPQRISRELSDFARDFYAAGVTQSRSADSLPLQPPPRHPQAQDSIPDDGRPTRTPVPGHPLLNNGKTLVYPDGYECHKCHNTGFKSHDPSNPCRRCWENYSKPYSGPIVYASWGPGPSNRLQRPLLNIRSLPPAPSLSPSITSLVNRARGDLSSYSGNRTRRSFSPPQVYPTRNTPPSPPRRRFDYVPMAANSEGSSTWPRNGPLHPVTVEPGDPRIGGQPCWNCFGSGRTLGFLLLGERTCGVCGGIGRLL